MSTTAVTGTVLDGAGTAMANAMVSAQFVGDPLSNVSGSDFPRLATPVICNSLGQFTITVTDNNSIRPLGTQWRFQFCPPATDPQCYQFLIGISGATQDITALIQIPAVIVNPSLTPRAYSSSEINNPRKGSFYWDLTLGHALIYDGLNWVPFSTNIIAGVYTINGDNSANQLLVGAGSVTIAQGPAGTTTISSSARIGSINSDSTVAQQIVGSGGIAVSTAAGVTTISGPTAVGVVTSINSDNTPGQKILAGTGISVTDTAGGNHSIAVTGVHSINGLTASDVSFIGQGSVSIASGGPGVITVTGQVFTQVNADWNANSGPAQILNKPAIPGFTTFGLDLSGSNTAQTVVGFYGKPLDSATFSTPTAGYAITYSSAIGKWVMSQILGGTQVNSDWNAASGPAMILNKPAVGGSVTLNTIAAAVATATISNAANTITWNWGLAGAANGLIIGESSVGSGTGALLQINGLSNAVTPLDVEGPQSQAHFGQSPSTGIWLQGSATGGNLLYNVNLVGGNFIARGTGTSILGSPSVGGFAFYGDTGKTVGSTFTPTTLETIAPTTTGGYTVHNLYVSNSPMATIISGPAAGSFNQGQTYDSNNTWTARNTGISSFALNSSNNGGFSFAGGTGFTIGATNPVIQTLKTIVPLANGTVVATNFYVSGTPIHSILSSGGAFASIGGAIYDGTNWIATQTSSARISINAVGYSLPGAIVFQCNTGLTVSGAFNPTSQVMIFNPTNIASEIVLFYNSVQNSSMFTAGGFYLGGQVTWNGASWIAQATACSAIAIGSPSYPSAGGIGFLSWGASGLTVGAALPNPSLIASISATGIFTCTNVTTNSVVINSTGAGWPLTITASTSNGGLLVYSNNQAQYFSISIAVGGNPTLYSNTGYISLGSGTNVTMSGGALQFPNTVVNGGQIQTLGNGSCIHVGVGGGNFMHLCSGCYYNTGSGGWYATQNNQTITGKGTNHSWFVNTAPAFSVFTPTQLMQLSNTGLVVYSTINASVGYRCQPGINAGQRANNFNIDYTGTSQLWIDSTNTGTITVSSDVRLKENIELFDNALPLVMRLRPVKFDWRDIPDSIFMSDGIRHLGFLAHEIQDILPSAVTGERDALTRDGGIQPQGILDRELIALLTAGLQELAKKVENLEVSHGFTKRQ